MSSSRRSRSRRAGSSVPSSSSSSRTSISEDQIAELLSKLQALLPESQARNGAHRGSAARVLQETCSYIRSLHQEVDNLSETLAQLLASPDVTSDQAAVIRSLLM
ncbi:transcription factor ILI1 [Oryza sativa Japonica Group]|uniref:Transcription factor ILI1 n=6 Tax=Oryza TaxID=4527 RepID=ILI1_ORYSJ|nr:transcription factor ILI1 [Oryza sativa Japonica Group]A2XY47.1 RecName: Full=Transcription factor ILI1; AltName: Full=Basic helix-loop-helix protein 154; AltName: Full=Protein INCREASED LEAF INCLINATION 1; AltName: Full=bHLH transcription factor bHLH154 [Oryza sativa Indica Group]Q7X742.2 RecName: Full=Transcription factor ILI1; Short=OsILI1; AltName: Full=Basic helix-loop-helix protein 154; Short=OsbHLH154; AltName: Full=Protein INCREASED LEAF INCLINATION 1; AltName: Full=bHLH transcription 